jgi:hypothetical protein
MPSVWSSTIALAVPAMRISMSDFDPSGFARASTSSSEYLIPVFTQPPGANRVVPHFADFGTTSTEVT